MYIRDMPFSAQAQELTVHGEKVTVFAFEPIVWVSITPPDVTVLPDDAPKFPAIVDTGNVVAFNIRESQLTAWTRPQLRSADLSLASPPRPVHDASGNVHRLPRLRARVWLHPYPEDNGLPALDLQVLGGILVYETLSATQEPPRAAGPHLPLLGAGLPPERTQGRRRLPTPTCEHRRREPADGKWLALEILGEALVAESHEVAWGLPQVAW